MWRQLPRQLCIALLVDVKAFRAAKTSQRGQHAETSVKREDDGGFSSNHLYMCMQAAQQKKRTPAWTDRVLWRSDAAKQLSYGSAELTASDHMPVAATFSLPVREYNRYGPSRYLEAQYLSF